MPNFIVCTDWKWQSSTLPIKKLINNQEQTDDQMIYQAVSCDIELNSSEKVKVQLGKDFPFEKNIGFIWHKSWNVPEIKVTIEEGQMKNLREQYEEIFCEVMAVYPVKNNKFYYLQQVGLGGNSAQKFNQNQVQLKYLKFLVTSFNYNRNKFCLLLIIKARNQEGDIHDLYSLISSPIYVDSRKEARKKVEKSMNFLLSQSPKKFFTSVGSRKGPQFNSPEGFLNYYGAQNIRNKIKHYFYLGLHFDKIFSIYRNSMIEMSLEEILDSINTSKKLKETLILVVINVEGEKDKKKILNMIEKWKYNHVEFTYSDAKFSKKWVPISKQQIKSSYKTYYERQLLRQDAQNDMEEEEKEKKQKPEDKKQFEFQTVIQLNKGGRFIKYESSQ